MNIRPYLTRHNIAIATGLAINFFIALLTLLGAYGGMISPETMPSASLAVMAFPIILLLDIVVIIFDIWLYKKMALVPTGAIILSIGGIITFSPINIPHGELTDDELQREFTLLTYNVLNFIDNEGIYPDNTNRTITYLLSTDADILCLQECEYLCPFPLYCVTKEQVDSLIERYPYRHIGRNGQSLLSKYPFFPIPLKVTEEDNAAMTAFRTNIDGHVVTLFNVHLQSLGLTVSDKELFLQMTNLEPTKTLSHIRSQLVEKLFDAFRLRASQAERISLWVEALNDNNIILCGDFNDIPGSYAHRTICSAGLRDAYADAAFGPMITYNANRFYFHIDQVLYSGELEAVDIRRGDLPCSDHYPLLTTFVWDENLRKPWVFHTTSSPIDTTFYNPKKSRRR